MSTGELHSSYSRAPSNALKALLSPNGLLAPMVQASDKTISGLPLDVHLRSNDEVHIYCGLTRILRVRRNKNDTVSVSAHQAYSSQECAKGLLRRWNTPDINEFRLALETYFGQVQVQERHTSQEGRIQAVWSGIKEPWIPFDREAVLEYRTKQESSEARKLPTVDHARSKLEAIAESQQGFSRESDGWAMPGGPGREVDQLAVDAEGRLVLIELKSASATPSAVYYAPFQLLQYIWEWHHALPLVVAQLQKLIDARAELGLSHVPGHRLTGDLRAAVCFDRDIGSEQVKARYDRVLEVVNGHLPEGVPKIETWTMDDVPALEKSPGQGLIARSRSGGTSFAVSLQEHLEDWRREVDGSSDRMWKSWTDGIYPEYLEIAQEVVSTDSVKLHQYAAHLRSSQVFAFNLFLPFREGNRARLSKRISEVIGAGFSIAEVGFEWVPPGALLGEIDGDRPVGNEPATAVDVVLWGRLQGDRPAAVLLEVKLSEPDFTYCGGRDSPGNDKKHVCASAVRFLENPNDCYLRRPQRQQRDRRYWEIFTSSHGSVLAAFPGVDTEGQCPFAYGMQQPMRNLAIARGLEQAQDIDVEKAWFGLCAHDENKNVAEHWEGWKNLLGGGTLAPSIPASEIVRVGEAEGLQEWAAWMRKRYRL